MNAYQGMLRMVELDTEMKSLGDRLSKTNDGIEKEVLGKRMDNLDSEFVNLKHSMEEIKLNLNIKGVY